MGDATRKAELKLQQGVYKDREQEWGLSAGREGGGSVPKLTLLSTGCGSWL